jgi:hypothetical protein
MSTDYSAMPSPPDEVSASTILARMFDAAGFRYFWATADLPQGALGFSPAAGSMELGQLLQHLESLAGWMHAGLTGAAFSGASETPGAVRSQTLELLAACSARVSAMAPADLHSVTLARGGGEALPMWNLIHGPLADFLSHVGQVTTWRRMAGCPGQVPRYARGLGPDGAASVSQPKGDHPRGLHFQDADLTESTFRDVALTGSTFDDVSLAGAKFSNATFAGATIHNVDLSNVNITDANIDGLRIDGELISE